jgi:hypothetical protein
MRGDEKRVVDAFVAWLQENGWTADTEVNFVDVCARCGDERLYAEAKGRTAAIGLDVDTLYGQLLRRMADPGAGARYAVVVPPAAIPAALRVPAWVRQRLDVDRTRLTMPEEFTRGSERSLQAPRVNCGSPSHSPKRNA